MSKTIFYPHHLGTLVKYKALLILMALTTAILLAGCSSLDEYVDAEITIVVNRAWEQNETEDGFEPTTGKVFVYLNVSFTNHNKDQDHSISGSHFFAYTQDDEEIWIFRGEELTDTSVGPGETLDVTIHFMVSEDDTLVKLKYTQRVSDPVEATIPAVS